MADETILLMMSMQQKILGGRASVDLMDSKNGRDVYYPEMD